MNKQHVPIIVGIALPIIMMIAVSIFISINKASVRPAHDFVYALINQKNEYSPKIYYFPYTYKVQDNKIVISKDAVEDATSRGYYPDLYRYDVAKDAVSPLTLEEAQKLVIDDSKMSSDGYVVEYDYNNNGVFELFGSSNNNGSTYVIRNNSARKNLNIITNNRWSDDVVFIGWIK